MTVEEARFELARLRVRQKQVEREVLAILNRGCLPLEEAKKRIDAMEASGVKTEIINGTKHLVEKRIFDGQERGITVLPLWYPRYAGIGDVFKSLEMDRAMVKELKRIQAEKKPMGIKNEAGGGYIAGHEKVFEKIEEYTANKTKIEELDGALALNQDGLGEALEHFFMTSLKEKYPETYKAVKSGLKKGCILFDGEKFNFKLPVGMVSRLFYNTGCTEFKEIAQYILIGGKDPNVSSLKSPLNFRGGLWPELKKLLEL
jgi:hypothetical protein